MLNYHSPGERRRRKKPIKRVRRNGKGTVRWDTAIRIPHLLHALEGKYRFANGLQMLQTSNHIPPAVRCLLHTFLSSLLQIKCNRFCQDPCQVMRQQRNVRILLSIRNWGQFEISDIVSRGSSERYSVARSMWNCLKIALNCRKWFKCSW